MDDATRAAANSTTGTTNSLVQPIHSAYTDNSQLNLILAPVDLIIGEPVPKKRCLRAPSDFSNIDEDPLEVSDSGFGDLPLSSCSSSNVLLEDEEVLQNGDEGVGPFYDVANTSGGQLFGFGLLNNNIGTAPVPVCVTNGIRTSSLDTLSLSTEINDFIDPEDVDEVDTTVLPAPNSIPGSTQQLLNTSTNSSDSSASDPCCSSVNTSEANQSANSDEDPTWDHIMKNKEISEHPSRARMMQRFLSQLRQNPNDTQLQHFLSLLLSSPEFAAPRERLRHVTTINDVNRVLRCSKKILVLTGAGISVSCGIPDFRSKDGLYSRVSKVFPFLRDPQSVFDIRLFKRDPRPFFLTAKDLYPGQFAPSLSHKFIRSLETRGQLLRNYSQNIDTLEDIAGIEKATMCHGSFSTATCIRCKHKVKADDIKEKVLAGDVPYCPACSTEEETSKIQFPISSPSLSSPQSPAGLHRRPSFDDEDDEFTFRADLLPVPPVLKPDIVFFGEDLPEEFHNNLEMDKHECDLLLVIGSSLRVRPVSLIPGMLLPEVPQILINRESLPHCRFDVELLGNCDAIISQLCRGLGQEFESLASNVELAEIDKIPRPEPEVTEKSKEVKDVKEPENENDIQALKAMWEPKIHENISEKLPENTFLNWRPRQYVFEGAEELFDPDESDASDSDDESSSESDSDSSDSINTFDSNSQPNDKLSPKTGADKPATAAEQVLVEQKTQAKSEN